MHTEDQTRGYSEPTYETDSDEEQEGGVVGAVHEPHIEEQDSSSSDDQEAEDFCSANEYANDRDKKFIVRPITNSLTEDGKRITPIGVEKTREKKHSNAQVLKSPENKQKYEKNTQKTLTHKKLSNGHQKSAHGEPPGESALKYAMSLSKHPKLWKNQNLDAAKTTLKQLNNKNCFSNENFESLPTKNKLADEGSPHRTQNIERTDETEFFTTVQPLRFIDLMARKGLWNLGDFFIKFPWIFLAFPIILCGVCSLGGILRRQELLISHPFVSYQNSDRKGVKAVFNSSNQRYDVISLSDPSDFAVILKSVNGDGNLLTENMVEKYLAVKKQIESIKVMDYNKNIFTYNSLCRNVQDTCGSNVIEAAMNGGKNIKFKYPEMEVPGNGLSSKNGTLIYSGDIFGGVETDLDGSIARAQSLAMYFKLATAQSKFDANFDHALKWWAKEFRFFAENLINQTTAEYSILWWSREGFNFIVAETFRSIYIHSSVSLGIVLIGSILICINFFGLRCKIWIFTGLATDFSVIFTIAGSISVTVGIDAYFNAAILPLLYSIAGISLLISANAMQSWRKYNAVVISPAEKLKFVLSWETSSIILICIITAASFALTSLSTDIPLLKTSCYAVALAATLLPLLTAFMLVGSLYFCEKRELSNSIKCLDLDEKILDKIANPIIRVYDLFDLGTLHTKLLDRRPGRLTRRVGRLISTAHARYFALSLFCVYLTFACWGCSLATVRLDQRQYLRRGGAQAAAGTLGATTHDFLTAFDKFYAPNNDNVVRILFTDTVDYYDHDTRAAILDALAYLQYDQRLADRVVDHDLEIETQTLTVMCVVAAAMSGVSLVTFGQPLTSLLCFFCMISTTSGTIGIGALWDVPLNALNTATILATSSFTGLATLAFCLSYHNHQSRSSSAATYPPSADSNDRLSFACQSWIPAMTWSSILCIAGIAPLLLLAPCQFLVHTFKLFMLHFGFSFAHVFLFSPAVLTGVEGAHRALRDALKDAQGKKEAHGGWCGCCGGADEDADSIYYLPTTACPAIDPQYVEQFFRAKFREEIRSGVKRGIRELPPLPDRKAITDRPHPLAPDYNRREPDAHCLVVAQQNLQTAQPRQPQGRHHHVNPSRENGAFSGHPYDPRYVAQEPQFYEPNDPIQQRPDLLIGPNQISAYPGLNGGPYFEELVDGEDSADTHSPKQIVEHVETDESVDGQSEKRHVKNNPKISYAKVTKEIPVDAYTTERVTAEKYTIEGDGTKFDLPPDWKRFWIKGNLKSTQELDSPVDRQHLVSSQFPPYGQQHYASPPLLHRGSPYVAAYNPKSPTQAPPLHPHYGGSGQAHPGHMPEMVAAHGPGAYQQMPHHRPNYGRPNFEQRRGTYYPADGDRFSGGGIPPSQKPPAKAGGNGRPRKTVKPSPATGHSSKHNVPPAYY